MAQMDKAEKKAKSTSSQGWSRDRMNKTHRKGRKKAKEVSNSARRSFGKAVVKGALKSEPPPKASKGIEPLDYTQCQAEINEGVIIRNFMQMGGSIGKPERCTNRPKVTVLETVPGKDGKRGQMSLCDRCLAVLKKVVPDWRGKFSIMDIACPDAPDGLHVPDPTSITSQMGKELVVDINCVNCGTSGSATIDPTDILW